MPVICHYKPQISDEVNCIHRIGYRMKYELFTASAFDTVC